MSGVVKEANRYGKSGVTSEDVTEIPNMVGMIQPFATSTAPKGWLVCDNSAVSRTEYSQLFAAIGTTWGSGDGSTTFNVPNLNGFFLRGTGTSDLQMSNTNAYQGGNIGTLANDQFQNFRFADHTGHIKVGGPDTGWGFIGRSIGNHGMAYRTGTFYYDHTQGGNSPYSSQFAHDTSWVDKGGTTATSGGTLRRGGETRPFSASIQYMIKY